MSPVRHAPADLVFRNGAVYTVDAARSWARTVAVRQGRIVHVANPSKALLDRITPDRPALLVTAVDLVSRLLPERTDSELGMGLDRALPLAAERGITANMEASASEGMLRAYAAADRAGRLTLRVVVAANAEPDSTGVAGVVRRLAGWRARYATPRVRPSTAKLFEDGVIESGTAALLAPYLDRKGDAGKPIYPQPVLDSVVTALDRSGWQVHVHAIGDRARGSADWVWSRTSSPSGPTGTST